MNMKCSDDQYRMNFYEKGDRVDYNSGTFADADVYVCPHCDKWIYADQPLTVKDLVDYLLTLPPDAELFTYGGIGGFLSLDEPREIESYFKLNPDENTLYINNVQYEEEDRKRISEGKEWLDVLNDSK